MGAVHVAHQARVEAPPKRRRERQLVAWLDLKRVAERPRPPAPGTVSTRVAAQELVGRGQLRADLRRLAPRRLGVISSLRKSARASSATHRPDARLARAVCASALKLVTRVARLLALALETFDLALQLALAFAVDLASACLQRAHTIHARLLLRQLAVLAASLAGPLLERAELDLDATRALGERGGGGGRLLAAHLQALARRARLIYPLGERVVALGALGQRTLGRPRRSTTARRRDSICSRAALAACTPSSASTSCTSPGPTASRASSKRACSIWCSKRSCNSAASAWRLSGRRRVRASRSTSSALSRFSCVRSSFSCARRRRLRCLPRPAASSIKQAPVARLGGHDRLDPPLGDDRVGLLAEAGVGEHLDHVDEASASAVEPILAVARAIEPAHDRDLRRAADRPCHRSCRARSRPPRRCAPARHGRRRRSRPASTGP